MLLDYVHALWGHWVPLMGAGPFLVDRLISWFLPKVRKWLDNFPQRQQLYLLIAAGGVLWSGFLSWQDAHIISENLLINKNRAQGYGLIGGPYKKIERENLRLVLNVIRKRLSDLALPPGDELRILLNEGHWSPLSIEDREKYYVSLMDYLKNMSIQQQSIRVIYRDNYIYENEILDSVRDSDEVIGRSSTEISRFSRLVRGAIDFKLTPDEQLLFLSDENERAFGIVEEYIRTIKLSISSIDSKLAALDSHN